MSTATDRAGCCGRNWMEAAGPKRSYARHRFNPDDPELFYPKSHSTKFINLMVMCVRTAFHDKSQLPMLQHLSGPGRETVFAYLGCLVYYWKQLTPIIAPKIGNERDLWARDRFAEKAGVSCPRAKFAEKELEISGLFNLHRQGGQRPALRELMFTLVREFRYEVWQALPDFPSKTKNDKGLTDWIKSMFQPEGQARAVGQERSRTLGELKGPVTPEESARTFKIGNRWLDEIFKNRGQTRKAWPTGPPVGGALPSPA